MAEVSEEHCNPSGARTHTHKPLWAHRQMQMEHRAACTMVQTCVTHVRRGGGGGGGVMHKHTVK